MINEMLDQLNQQVSKLAKENEQLKNANRFIQNFAEELHRRNVELEFFELNDEKIKDVMSKFYSYNPRLMEFAKAVIKASRGEK
jgi:hypothetical protein